MKGNSMNTTQGYTVYFSEIEVGQHFRIPGYDDLFLKVSATHAKDMGCGWLKRPTRFARKGERILMATLGSDASGLMNA